MPTLPIVTEWLRAGVTGGAIGVDRKQQIIHGYVVAQEGPFKSDDRGEFDESALRQIVKLIKAAPNGLKSRFAHPSLSDDGIGKFLGRVKDPRIEEIGPRESYGGKRTDTVKAVRGDLHLDPTSRNTPSGDLGGYVMDLAESDPDALSSSLVLTTEKAFRIDKKGRPLKDDAGNELPPLWRPQALHASDVVDTGDAVDGMLSLDIETEAILPDAIVRQGAKLLDKQFAGQPREAVEARCEAWLSRYLDMRYGEESGESLADAILSSLPTLTREDLYRVRAAVGEAMAEFEVPETYDPARDADLRRRRLRQRRRSP